MTVLTSPYIKAKTGSFCNKRIFFHLFLSGYANLSHNFTSLVLVTSSLLLSVVFQSSSNELVTLAIIAELPVYLCLVFIMIRFAVLLCLEVQRKWFHSPRELDKVDKRPLRKTYE